MLDEFSPNRSKRLQNYEFVMKNIFVFHVFTTSQSKEGGKDRSTHFSAELQKGTFQPMIWPFDNKNFFKLNSNEHEIYPAYIC